jgi:hypothetical protein
VLLEGDNFARTNGQHMGHLYRCRLAVALALPGVVPEGHDCVTFGDKLLGCDSEVITDFSESPASLPINVRKADLIGSLCVS